MMGWLQTQTQIVYSSLLNDRLSIYTDVILDAGCRTNITQLKAIRSKLLLTASTDNIVEVKM